MTPLCEVALQHVPEPLGHMARGRDPGVLMFSHFPLVPQKTCTGWPEGKKFRRSILVKCWLS